MGKQTDVAVRASIKAGERFEGRTDGDGLVLSWRPDRTAPHGRLRYRFAGKSRVLKLGSTTELLLAAARQSAKELRAKIALGHDVAGEKQERKSTALARIVAARSLTTVGQLADEHFERIINGRWKHPNIVRSRIEKDLRPPLGKLALDALDALEPRLIDVMLRAVVKRGALAIANDVLRWVRCMFDCTSKRHRVRWMFFNLHVGNNDNHTKSLSIYSVPGQGVSLTPFYDLMCTRLCPGLSPEFAFAIGGELRPGGMGAQHLALMATQLGMQPRFPAQQARDRAERVPDAIGQAAREIAPSLTPSARNLAEQLNHFASSTPKKPAARLTA